MVSNKSMKLSEIVIDEKIYPRESVQKDKVDEYVEAMKEGGTFPPLVIHESTKILEDGYHRYLAHKEMGHESVEVELDPKPEIKDLEKERYKLMLRAAWYNARHGIQLKLSEKETVARNVARSDTNREISQKDLADQLGVHQTTVSNWIKDIKEERDRKRDHLIFRLDKLGWTLQEIGELVGIDNSQVSRILDLSFKKFLKTQNDLLQKGYKIEDISNKLGCNDIPLLWSLGLENETDDVKMIKFGCEPQLFNVWNFQSLDERLGLDWVGRIPGQIAMNVLYYYTKPGDLVVDPMTGGGSTVDACLVMGRRCRAYDIAPNVERRDIIENDLIKGYPEKAKKADLIFLDPPYWDMVKYSEKSISTSSVNDFYNYIKIIAKNTHEALKPSGITTFIICDLTRDETFECLTHECAKLFEQEGFKIIHRISVPLSTQSANGDEVNKAKQNKKLLGRDRVLYIFRKV